MVQKTINYVYLLHSGKNFKNIKYKIFINVKKAFNK